MDARTNNSHRINAAGERLFIEVLRVHEQERHAHARARDRQMHTHTHTASDLARSERRPVTVVDHQDSSSTEFQLLDYLVHATAKGEVQQRSAMVRRYESAVCQKHSPPV